MQLFKGVIAFVLVVSLLGQILSGSSLFTGQSTGQISIEPAALDLGPVDVGTEVRHSFLVSNTGKGSVTLQQPVVNCGCMSAFVGSSRLAPGKRVELEWKLIVPEALGQFEKQILVATEDDQITNIIKISGRARPATRSYPPELRIETDASGIGIGRLRATHPGVKGIQDVRSSNREMTVVSWTLVKEEPGETLIDVSVNSRAPGSGELSLFADTGAKVLMVVPVKWNEPPKFIVQPPTVYMSCPDRSATPFATSVFVLPRRQFDARGIAARPLTDGVSIGQPTVLDHSNAVRVDITVARENLRGVPARHLLEVYDAREAESHAVLGMCADAPSIESP